MDRLRTKATAKTVQTEQSQCLRECKVVVKSAGRDGENFLEEGMLEDTKIALANKETNIPFKRKKTAKAAG